jgi:hypothetical protein
MTRDELFEQFGPMIIEAVCLVVKDEINILRTQHGLAERTNQQIVDAVGAKLNSLGNYGWLNSEADGHSS